MVVELILRGLQHGLQPLDQKYPSVDAQVLNQENKKSKPDYELAHLVEAAAPLFESLLTFSLQQPTLPTKQ
jgi:hypothetical protein